MDRPWQQLQQLMKKHQPGAAELYHPRRYRTPKGYCSSLQVALALGMSWAKNDEEFRKVIEAGDGGNMMRAAAVSNRILQLGVPIYHVGQQFAEALLHTDLPAIPNEELRWAMPGAVFLLPRGLVTNSSGWPLEFLAVAIYGSGKPQKIIEIEGSECFAFTTSIAEGTESALDISIYSGMIHRSQFATLDQLPHANQDLQIHEFNPNYPQKADPADEDRFLKLLGSLAVHLMLALGEPERFVETNEAPPEVTPVSKGFGSRQRQQVLEVWEPNWLGRTYQARTSTDKAPRPEGGGTHARPRTHWRRGHWRRVPYGTMDALPRPVRRVFVDPVLINPDVGATQKNP